MKRHALTALGICFVLTVPAWSQPPDSGPREGGRGPGMMGGYGSGMMGGYGPGMMGGYGAGMMGGYGAGGWGPNIPDLTNEQRTKIADIQKDLRKKQWALMEKMHEDFASTNFYRSGKFDEQAARKAYDASASLHKQMFDNFIDAQKRIDSVLTPQQHEQLQRAWGGR